LDEDDEEEMEEKEKAVTGVPPVLFIALPAGFFFG